MLSHCSKRRRHSAVRTSCRETVTVISTGDGNPSCCPSGCAAVMIYCGGWSGASRRDFSISTSTPAETRFAGPRPRCPLSSFPAARNSSQVTQAEYTGVCARLPRVGYFFGGKRSLSSPSKRAEFLTSPAASAAWFSDNASLMAGSSLKCPFCSPTYGAFELRKGHTLSNISNETLF